MEDDTQLVSETTMKLPEEFGNNLSFPVIWSDGYALYLREPPINGPLLEGEWWYVWGDQITSPGSPICSCKPHSKLHFTCEDGSTPGDGISEVYKAYPQNQPNNIWQAESYSQVSTPLNVDLVDWEDDLEIRDWDLNSNVEMELSFYENLTIPMIQFAMKRVTGWGTNEIDGLKTTLSDLLILEPGNMASVYSHNLRITIQKLNVYKDSIPRGSLMWEPLRGWTETDPNGENIINDPILNYPVYETNEGPEYFQGLVNTQGKVVYHYSWDVRNLNEGEGYYRLTYSFDENSSQVPLNTFFDANTEIMQLNEKLHPNPIMGGEAKLDIQNNLTYMDIRVKESGIDHE